MSLAFVPVFVEFLGQESYGLIGIYISIFTIATFLDLGLSTALTRLLSVLNTETESLVQEVKNSLRTFELVYFAIGGCISLMIVALAPWISHHWLELKEIDPQRIYHCLNLMAALLFFQWPITLYTGGFLGIERHVELNLIRSIHAALQWGGTAFVIVYVATSIEAFFISQLTITVVTNLGMRHRLWRSIHKLATGSVIRFDIKTLTASSKYIGGLTILSFFTVFYGQIDRILISKMLPLAQLGIYTIAMQIVGALMYVGVPVYQAIFPKISRMIANGHPELGDFYHRSTQLLAMLTLPITFLLFTYGQEIIFVWTQDKDVAQRAQEIVRFAVIAVNLFVVGFLPLSLMLASKKTQYNNIYASVCILIVPLMMYFSLQTWGVIGAPLVLCCYYLGWHLVLGPLIHHKILDYKWISWACLDLLAPLFAGSIVIVIFDHYFYPAIDTLAFRFVYWAVLWFVMSFTMLLVISHGRHELVLRLKLLFSR